MSDAIDRLTEIMDRLRDPGGCPWDREQTLATLAPYLLEEAHEVAEAVAADDPAKLREELGDLLLQIVFMARIGRESGWFSLDDVADGISAKMVRRHPHVFADRKVADTSEVLRNWEDIKRDERADADRDASALDGVPSALPGLLKAFRMTEKAAAVGFDWRRPADVMVTMREEMAELEAELGDGAGAATDRLRDEMGDVLFVLANLARHLGVEPETALQRSNASFKRRFESMEAQARARGRSLRELSLEEQDALWEEAKRLEGRPSDVPRSR
ncbi:MAG TPA: nucleoside triphosphate pyrophosphohydrolase [Candidatus Sulfomarinibacteraceae bacterium]|nr:nucleoside triphosphate pyrophosphohydrolase [Candidatus Sulfomarinibacteraceae bacterium]